LYGLGLIKDRVGLWEMGFVVVVLLHLEAFGIACETIEEAQDRPWDVVDLLWKNY
jgi:hypothetical protein